MKPQILPGTKTLKSGKSYTIPLREDVVDVLMELSRTKQHELIFTENGMPLTYRRIQHKYENAFKRAGLPYRGTHVCRHTGATTFLDETGDFLALQQMGGWSDLKMALHYGQILSTRARKAVAKADEKRRHLRLVKAKEDEKLG